MKSDYRPLGVKYLNRDHEQHPDNTQIYANRALPDPEIKGHGVVISKDGKVKKDGSHTQ